MNIKKITTSKMPWPTKDAMTQIYEMNLWGSKNTRFYSGEGSHNLDIVRPYIVAVTSFLKSMKHPLILCDLGCGDFNVGRQLVSYVEQYHAVDIVPQLIVHNTRNFKNHNLKFHCLNIAEDNLPSGDCVLLRQVLQHLSNAEILKILKKIKDYKYVIITEHIPEGEFTANKDILSGQGIRLKKKSGVDVLASPFNFNVEKKQLLHSLILNDNKGVINTTLYKI